MAEISEPSNKSATHRLTFMFLGVAAVSTGVFGIAFGSLWSQQALDLFAVNAVVQKFELVVPFAPIALIALGAFLGVKSRL